MQYEDLAGNTFTPTGGLAITIDQQDPQRATIDLTGPDVRDNDKLGVAPINSDTGMDTTDNVTMGINPDVANDQTQVQVRVSAEPGSTVVIKDGEDVIDTFRMPTTLTATSPLSGDQQVPATGSAATGTVMVTLDTITNQFSWNVSNSRSRVRAFPYRKFNANLANKGSINVANRMGHATNHR